MFEGSLYGTSMQSLTLVIWGACRTPDGPGFEPLISNASECDSFEGKTLREEYFVTIRVYLGQAKRHGRRLTV